MNIKDRLRLLDRAATTPAPAAPRKRIDTELDQITDALDGEIISNEHGSFVRIRSHHPTEALHGRIALDGAARLNNDNLVIAAKNKISGKFSINDALFIDTETTGLAGGTGTYAFLVGIGFLHEQNFVVEQYFLPRLEDEMALLSHLDTELSSHDGLVSFNGKSFDIPLLATRFITHRLEPSLMLHEHLDLLHAARRLWKGDYGDCSLGTLERAVLGFDRGPDIPGEEIPWVYANFLRTGELTRLPEVIQHNRFDIVSLLALAVLIDRRVGQPADTATPRAELPRIARLYEQSRRPDDAATLYAILGEEGKMSEAERVDCLMALGRLLKRQRRYDQAEHAFQQVLRSSLAPIDAFVELAKHFEHRARDLDAALHFTKRALAKLETRLSLRPSAELSGSKQDLLHRQARLERKRGQAK